MAGFKPSELGFDRAGILALLFALATLGAEIFLFATMRKPPGITTLLIVLFFSIASIFTLFRFQVPDFVRFPLTAVMILALLVMGIRTDPFGIARMRDEVSEGSGVVPRGALRSAEKGTTRDEPAAPVNPVDARSHPRIALSPDPAGDRGWAARINSEVAKSVSAPGAFDFILEGVVSSSGNDAGERVMIVWSLQAGDKWVSCGSMTAMSPNGALILDQIKGVFGKAITESIKRGQPTCF